MQEPVYTSTAIATCVFGGGMKFMYCGGSLPGWRVYSDLCVHIVYSVQVLNPTMTKCVGGEGARGGESH